MPEYVVVEGRALAKAMKIANAIIEKRNTIPILGCVRLTYGAAGLSIEGTDLDMEIRIAVDEIEGEGEFSVCLEATSLAAIAGAAGVANLRIERGTRTVPGYKTRNGDVPEREADTITITLGDGDAAYEIENVLPTSDWPELDKPRADLIERFTNGMFAATLQKVAWAISTEETRYYLNGVCMQRNANGRHLVATDGHRLAACRYDAEGGNAVESRIIPRKTVAFMINHFQGLDVEIFATQAENVIEIVAPAMRLRTKLIDGTFPDVDRVIPRSQAINQVLEFKRDEIATAIRQAIAVGGDRRGGPAIRFHGIGGKLHIERKNVDFGTAKVRTSTDWPEDDIQPFGFNSRYMLEIVANCQGPIKFGYQDSGAPFLVGDDDETMTRVIMPMRV